MLTFSLGFESQPKVVVTEEAVSATSMSNGRLSSEDHSEGEPYEMHPLHGALPPSPMVRSTTIPINVLVDDKDDDSDTMHPIHGQVPFSVCAQNQSGQSLSTFHLSSYDGLESEQGGQSLLQTSISSGGLSGQLTSIGTTCSVSMTSDSSCSSREESIEIVKLEAIIKDLSFQLKEAQVEIKKKDDKIRQLHEQLKLSKNFEETSSQQIVQPLRPYNLQLNGPAAGSRPYNMSSSTYSNSHHHMHCHHSSDRHASGQGPESSKSFSNSTFNNRSKSGTPNASVSVV